MSKQVTQTTCNSIGVKKTKQTNIENSCILITSAVLALTDYTLTAVLTAQFTSPHHLTQAGEGKIPATTSSKTTSGTLSGRATLLATYCVKEGWSRTRRCRVLLAVVQNIFIQ